MTIDGLLRRYILEDTAIGGLVDERVYPIRLPQKPTLPAITYQMVSDVRQAHLRGPDGLSRKRFQVDVYAKTHAEVKALGGLCRQHLDAFSGMWSDQASPETAVRVTILFDTAIDLFDEDILGGSCRESADYFVIHGTADGTV